MGVRGILFKNPEDYVIAMDVVRKQEDLLLTISRNGYGKVSKLSQFPRQKRGGQEMCIRDSIRTVEDLQKLPKDRFPEFILSTTIEDLVKHIPAPDFPTGAEMYDQAEIIRGYATGRGRVQMRAVAHIEERAGGKFRIVITELPYQVNKSNLVIKIADLHRDKKIIGIADLRDESTKTIRVVIDIKRDGNPNTVLNKLYKLSLIHI